MRAIVVL